MDQEVLINYRDGLHLAGLLNVPLTDDDAVPLVIMLHGFTGWKEEEHIASLAKMLNAAGIATLRFDAPGSGESDGTFAHDYRQTNYIESVGSVIQYAKRLARVDHDRLAIWGHSMGGFTSLAAGVQWGAELKAVGGSQASLGKGYIGGKALDAWKETGWLSYPNRRFPELELPYEFYEDRQKYNALDIVPNLHLPLLLMGGTKDREVPAATVKSIYDAANEPKQYVEFNVNHYYKLAPGPMQHINVAFTEFFVRELQPASPTNVGA